MTYPTLIEAYKLPGIADLPTKLRLHFAKAYLAELAGDALVAEEELNRAVKIEEELHQTCEAGLPAVAAEGRRRDMSGNNAIKTVQGAEKMLPLPNDPARRAKLRDLVRKGLITTEQARRHEVYCQFYVEDCRAR